MQTDYTTKSQAGAERYRLQLERVSFRSAPNAAGKSLHSRLLDRCPRIIPLPTRLFLSNQVAMPATRRSPLDFKMIQLIVNGQSRCFPAGDRVEAQDDDSSKGVLNISQVLEHMGLQGKRIAVERNGEIVPRSKFGQSMLVDGDRVEIVVAVGGG